MMPLPPLFPCSPLLPTPLLSTPSPPSYFPLFNPYFLLSLISSHYSSHRVNFIMFCPKLCSIQSSHPILYLHSHLHFNPILSSILPSYPVIHSSSLSCHPFFHPTLSSIFPSYPLSSQSYTLPS